MTERLTLGFDFRFEDLYRRDGLVRLDACFVDALEARNPDLHGRLMAARAAPDAVAGKAESDLIVELAVLGRMPLASVHRTPMFFLHTGTPELAGELARLLAAQGFYVCSTRFTPGSPKTAGIRFTLSLHNELEDIERFADVLGSAAQKLDHVRRPVVSVAAE